MAAPPKKSGIALVFGEPTKAPSPAGPVEDEASAELAELAAVAFPGTKVDLAALKELIHACIDGGYAE